MRRHCREATMSNRKMWKKRHKYLVFILFVFLGACASVPPPTAVSPTVVEQSLFTKSPSDTDIFKKGMSYLGNHEKAADYAKAREAFNELLTTYPGSKWRNISEALIRLINDMQSSGEKFQVDKAKLLKENELLKKDNRRLLEETAKLVQESEQLKKDLERLKSLEVQLEKREKMLR
jgi:hypothetical protein